MVSLVCDRSRSPASDNDIWRWEGKQVRDVLYIDDLIDAMMTSVESPNITQGEIYNIGGGMHFSLSVWREFGPLLSEMLGREISAEYGAWRPGDQKIYISDITKAHRDFGWEPSISPREGVERLVRWVQENRELFT